MIPALFCLLLLGQGALSNDYHINNPSEFIQFSKNVSSGTDYSGATVFLDDDIDFSGVSNQFKPIGNGNCFQEHLMKRDTQSVTLQ